jgi:hypothetical protein
MSVELDELKLVQDAYMNVLSLFITWYTWFIGLNIVAFSWIVTTEEKKLNYQYLTAFVIFVCSQLILGEVMTVGMVLYCRGVRQRALELLTHRPDKEKAVWGVVPTEITYVACMCIFVCQIVFFVLWIYVQRHLPQSL